MAKHKARAGVVQGIGVRIRIAREALGWSQQQLSRAVGVSKSAVSQWEKGAVQNLKLGNLFAVADALGKDVRHLVFGERGAVGEQHSPGYAERDAQMRAVLVVYESLPKDVQSSLRGLILALGRTTDRDRS